MDETWKDIEGYEGLYQVSNMGRVRSLRRNIILKKSITTRGYEKVVLNVNNIQKNLENSMDSLIIANGIFDHININKNVNIPYSTDIKSNSLIEQDKQISFIGNFYNPSTWMFNYLFSMLFYKRKFLF